MTSDSESMLKHAGVIAFVPTRNPGKARSFFETVLGLEFVSEDAFAVVFNVNGVMLRVVDVSSIAEFKPAPFAILGWLVPNVEVAVREMQAKGITFERYPWMEQSEPGIWTAPSGARIAWFKDPDGNVLSVTET